MFPFILLGRIVESFMRQFLYYLFISSFWCRFPRILQHQRAPRVGIKPVSKCKHSDTSQTHYLILGHSYWLFKLIWHFFHCYLQENKFCDNLDGDLLVQFLKEDIYVEADEDFLLHLVQRWVDCRPERKDWFLPLLRLIRFPLLHLDTLESLPR